jgi:high-affinity nickel permease
VSVSSIVTLGFLLGMRHATDADHVVAVAAIVSREHTMKVAARIGAWWGLGHSLTIVLVGAPIILLNWVVPPRVGLAMELSVGLMLVVLGAVNVTGIVHTLEQPASHQRENEIRAGAPLHHAFDRPPAFQRVRPILVGIVHGLAGSAAVALLVLTTIREPLRAVVYLVVFGVGTVAGMVVVTTAIALPFASATGAADRAHRRLQLVTGLLSVAFGCFIAYKIGIVGGVFGAEPHWTPE